MKDRRVLVTLGAVLFAVGFGLGYLARGEAELGPSDARGSVASGPLASPPEASGASSASDASASRARESASRRDEGDVPSAPSGGGTVAVIGQADTATAARGNVAGARNGTSGEPPALDGGARPTGRLDAAAIRDVVRAHRDQLGFCFAWQLHRHPELRGQLTMDFTIGEDGSVTRAEVSDDQLGDETVLTCFRGVTRRMQFPVPEGGEVRVRYPFVLAPEDPEE